MRKLNWPIIWVIIYEILFWVVVVGLVVWAVAGCAGTHTDVKKGTFTTLTCLKEITVQKLDIGTDANDKPYVHAEGVSNVSTQSDSVVSSIVAFFLGWFAK